MKRKINKKVYFEIIAIILIAIFCISLTPKTLQNDTFYTIKIGQHIIENQEIDMLDPFSWHQNLEYTYPHWLYDVITYLIYSIGGITGIYVSTCIFAIILGISIYKINSNLVQNKVISFLITLVAMYMLRDFITARAQLITFILFILQIYCIEKLINTSQKKYAVGLIVISILIANLHVAVWPFSFVLYLPYIVEYIVSILEHRIAEKYGKEVKQGTKILIEKKDSTKILIIVMIICILSGFITPLGTTPYTYLIKTMQGTTMQNINEHQPMTLINNIDILCAIIIILTILTFTNTKIKMTDLLMLGGLALLMLFSKRQSTMFIIIGSVAVNRIAHYWTEKNISNIDNKIIELTINKFGIFMVSAAVISLSLYFIKPKIKSPYIDERTYPVQMSEFILNYFEENNIRLSEVRLYNEYNYGSYLLFKDIPVFIDSRCDLYSPEYNEGVNIFNDFIDSSSLNIWFEDTLEKYDINYMILYKSSKMNMVIQEAKLKGYNLIKEDDNFVFYEVKGE